MAAISFIQWFGTQGLLKALLGGASIYGPIGIIMSAVYATFPHALMIVLTAMVLFSYTVSDFGIPKVIGGNFNILAVDIFKQVIGQQNFNKGAVVSLILLLPVLVAFIVDWIMQGKQQSQFS